jgi:hypothetical protein
MKKIYAVLIIALLTLSPLLAPMIASATITGKPTLYQVTSHTVNPDGTLDLGGMVSGDPIRTKANSNDQGDLVAIDMNGMTITGAQVWLYLSETGGATLEANDLYYAGPFNLVDVLAVVTSFANITDPYSGQTYWIGNNTIVGPMPSKMVVPRGANYYLKITDVSTLTLPQNIPSSDVAVSVNKWKPYPSISIDKTMGPAGTQISVTGIAFDPTKLVNITFGTSMASIDNDVVTLLSVGTDGTFVTSFYAPDLKTTSTADVVRYVNAYYNTTGLVVDSKAFTECGRGWLQVSSVVSPKASNNYHGGGVSVLQQIYVSGICFNPRSTVDLYWDYGSSMQSILKTGVSLNSTGFFNTTIVIPDSALGVHTITAIDLSFNFNATVTVGSTLILVPDNGPVNTAVEALGYGFPASNGAVYNVTLTWQGSSFKVVAWAVTDSTGKFVAYFNVPHDFGGGITVMAVANDTLSTSASDIFTITPSIVVLTDPIVNDCSIIQIYGSGFNPSADYLWYIDNSLYAGTSETFYVNGSGDIIIEFVAAGFRPGLHAVSTIVDDASTPYAVAAKDCFTVLTTGDLIFMGIEDGVASILTDVGVVKTSLTALDAKITQIRTDLLTVATSIGSVRLAVADVDATVTSIEGDVATVQTTVGSIKGTVENIKGNVATVKTDVGTIEANLSDEISSLENKVDVLDDKVDVLSLEATVESLTMPLWIAIILALIAAVAAVIAVIQLMRKIAG